MRRIVIVLVLLGLFGLGVFLIVTRPGHANPESFRGIEGNIARGEMVYYAAGCGSCHMAEGAQGEARLVLSGGQRFASPFGTFLAPNISPSEQGIANWSRQALADALWYGTGREHGHLYPALPYASYSKMTAQDLADLYEFLKTLPADPTPSAPHEVGFPFNIRASLGGWKMLFFTDDWVIEGDLSAEEARGRYLVEALGHCGECHTPRNALGGMDKNRWLAGLPGEGGAPNITPAKLGWSVEEIAYYLESGFTPDYDSVGGHMAYVVDNYAKLPPEDRAAVAAYLKRVPAVE